MISFAHLCIASLSLTHSLTHLTLPYLTSLLFSSSHPFSPIHNKKNNGHPPLPNQTNLPPSIQ